MNEYDVIIIGAGFGGPVAAKKCADAGLKTLMLERSENVGEKVISGLTIPIYGFLFGPAFIRDGNPPIERPVDGIQNYILKDIDAGDIEIDDSLKIPKPFSPVVAFGYNAYCKPLCEWGARKAIEAGAELRTSTVVTDVILDDSCVKGVITETGEKIRSRIVIDAEGSQGLVAIQAGVRRKYPPEAISLADIYDYEMPKERVDDIFGFSLRFCWGWDEQNCAPPLGHGNGLMVWPYRKSIHYMHDQCLRMDTSSVPNLKKKLAEYHRNITSKLPWWKEDVEPHASLRAHMWEGFEIFVGLNENLRSMPNHTDGMILVGDAAGLESTELCDGVPQAWISADIAADVAIEALKANNTSRAFLARYDKKIRDHPLLQWSISGTNRFNLRFAQQEHSLRKLRRYVHNGWGLGALTHATTPLVKTLCSHIIQNPLIIMKWRKMFYRYYYNWHHERFDYSGSVSAGTPKTLEERRHDERFRMRFRAGQACILAFVPLVWILAVLSFPLAKALNPAMKILLPVIEPLYSGILRLCAPLSERASRRKVEGLVKTDPTLFEV
ncbi:MAG: NAD(P)/FAD-dependent oxidoreductase [Desulfomonilia bacterium]